METTAKAKQEPDKTQSQSKPQTGHSRVESSVAGHQEDPYQITEKVEQAKQVISDAYDQTSKTLNKAYNTTLDYGRDNPGKMTLIAFGVGIGVGVLLANGSSRSRTSRIVPPVMNALSQIASELFR